MVYIRIIPLSAPAIKPVISIAPAQFACYYRAMNNTVKEKRGLAAIFRLCPGAHVLLLLSAAVIGAHLLLRRNHALMERISENIISPLHQAMASACALAGRLSLAEILISIFTVAVSVYIISEIYRLILRPGRGKRLYRMLVRLGATGLAVYAGYSLLWGVYYYGDDFIAESGLENDAISVQELETVTVYFAQLLNEYSALVSRDEAGLYVADKAGILERSHEVYAGVEKAFPCLEGVLDMIYNPARTQFLLDAEALELPRENGLWMLVAQAKEAAEYFGGMPLEDSLIEKVYDALSSQMQNIVLVGMPGSGKSSVGRALAKALGRVFVDADAEIAQLAGIPIPEIFARFGEDTFREYETRVLSELGKKSCLVIATGGGCVTRQRNYPLLHQNGRIVWLRRDLDRLPTDGRPLSQAGKLEDMYQARRALYEAFADFVVDNNGSLKDTVAAIAARLEG